MSNRHWIFALLVAVILLGTFKGLYLAAASDGSVRFLTAGPVRLGDGHTAHMRVLVPAVHRTIQLHLLGEGGKVLQTVDVEPPAGPTGRLTELTLDATFQGPGSTRFGTMNITDGTSNTIFSGPSNGIIAILIGLRQTKGTGIGMGTLELKNPAGETVGILPYIEQDNFR